MINVNSVTVIQIIMIKTETICTHLARSKGTIVVMANLFPGHSTTEEERAEKAHREQPRFSTPSAGWSQKCPSLWLTATSMQQAPVLPTPSYPNSKLGTGP